MNTPDPPTAKLYRIRDWNRHFENNRSRLIQAMSWVPVPNKHDGEGYRTIMAEPDGLMIYGAWHLILQVASKCRTRGILARDDGTPLTARAIALKTGCLEVQAIQRALDFCSSPEVGWIDVVTIENRPKTVEASLQRQVSVTETSGERQEGGNEQNRTEQKGRKEDRETPARAPGADSEIPSEADWLSNAARIGLSPDDAKGLYQKLTATGWKWKGDLILNWKAFQQSCKINSDTGRSQRRNASDRAGIDRNAGTLNAGRSAPATKADTPTSIVRGGRKPCLP